MPGDTYNPVEMPNGIPVDADDPLLRSLSRGCAFDDICSTLMMMGDVEDD